MRLLILGYSSIVQRRVLAAAAKTAAIDEISIASRSRPQPNDGWPKAGHFFTDYDTALRECGADIVYISLPNAMHEHWILAALAAPAHACTSILVSRGASAAGSRPSGSSPRRFLPSVSSSRSC